MRHLVLVLATLALCACARDEGITDAETPAAADVANKAPAIEPPQHHAELAPTQGNQARGKVEFISLGEQGVRLTGTITGLEPNSEHGFHVHEKGDCAAPDASSAGGHFNPSSQPHGDPAAQAHHAGDIPNIKADAQGSAQVNLEVRDLTVSGTGPNDIIGKAVVVHAKADDYKSQPAGNSGGRIACGVIR